VKASTVANYTRKTYLKFSLTNQSGAISSAKLRIYGSNTDNAATVTLSCYGVDSDSWTEDALTYANAPVGSPTVLSTAAVNNQGKYLEFDVTSFVKAQLAGDKIVSFVISDPANKNTTTSFNSRQNTNNRPQLVIN
jgi:hypothetical protein